MERKVAQIGPSTLMVSLPRKWVDANNVKKGAQLNVTLAPKEIIFSLGAKQEESKEITLDITHLSKHTLIRYLEILYINNYNKIILTYSKSVLYDDKNKKEVNVKEIIKKLSQRFIGMEIVSQTKELTELQCFLLDKEKDLNKIEKRIYFLFKETIEEFLTSLDKNHAEFHQNVYEHHDNIGKFITYYLRVLDQSEKSAEEKKQLYSLYMIIDKMLDKFRHVSEMISRHGCTEKIKKILKEIFELIEEQFMALFKGEITKELVTKRYNLVRKVESADYSLEELRVICEIKIFLDTINDFTRAAIVKRLGS